MLYRHCSLNFLQNIPLGTRNKNSVVLVRKRTIPTGEENLVGQKLDGTHQLLVYAVVNLLGDNIHTVKKNTQTLTDVRVNTKKTKYMLMSHQQNAGRMLI
jgi:hypothetical protein